MSSVLPAYYDFGALHRGDSTPPLAIAMSEDAAPAFSAVGASAVCQVRDPLTGTLLLEWSTAADTLWLIDGGALLRERIPAATASLSPDRYQAELEITEASGRRRTWLRGPITVMGDLVASATQPGDIGSNPTPVFFDFGTILRGDSTWPIGIAISFNDQVAFAAAGTSVLCQARDPDTDAVVLAWSTGNNTALVTDGCVLLRELSPEITGATVPGRYTCELEITEANGRVRTWLRGPLTITGDVARA